MKSSSSQDVPNRGALCAAGWCWELLIYLSHTRARLYTAPYKNAQTQYRNPHDQRYMITPYPEVKRSKLTLGPVFSWPNPSTWGWLPPDARVVFPPTVHNCTRRLQAVAGRMETAKSDSRTIEGLVIVIASGWLSFYQVGPRTVWAAPSCNVCACFSGWWAIVVFVGVCAAGGSLQVSSENAYIYTDSSSSSSTSYTDCNCNRLQLCNCIFPRGIEYTSLVLIVVL